MEQITRSQFLAIPKAYRGIYSDVQGVHPEWKGRRTAFLPGHGTTLFIEGVSFEIVDEEKHYAVCIYDLDGGSGEMKCTAKNKTEARRKGREYIKSWKLRGAKIEYIRELDEQEVAQYEAKDELANVQAVFSENLDRIKEYAPQLKASGRYKVFENRLAWDCLKAFVGVDTLCSWYDKYGCTDTHIESVGRAALRNLGMI